MRTINVICLALLLSISSLAIPPAAAQTVGVDDLDTILSEQKAASEREAKLKLEREKIQSDITGLNQKLGDQIKTLSKLGDDIHTARTKYTELDEAYHIKRAAFLEDEKSLSRFLGYIQRLERRKPSPALTSPSSALKSAQTAILIKSLTREFDIKSRGLKEQIKDVSTLREALITQQAGLEQKQSRVQSEESRLKALVDTRREKAALIADEEKQARQRAAQLAAKAASLKELLEKLEQADRDITPRIKPKPNSGGPARERSFSQNAKAKRFTQAKRELVSPVKGRLIKNFGRGEQGLTLLAQARSDVRAPYFGRVEFAGPFKDYENLLILNVGEGYFLLLTGLSNTIVEVGESIKRGDIVGALPASTTGQSEIYVELRKNGEPIDSRPWFNGF